jgi:CRP-like cAMP-binding protein
MSAHTRKVHRMLAVQQQLHRIEEWRLAELRARLDELAADQKELIAALNEDDALQGLFIDSMARRLQSLSEAASATGKDTQLQAVRLLEQAGRLICAERLAKAADLQELRSNEKSDLAEAIERLGDAQASRKIVGR